MDAWAFDDSDHIAVVPGRETLVRMIAQVDEPAQVPGLVSSESGVLNPQVPLHQNILIAFVEQSEALAQYEWPQTW